MRVPLAVHPLEDRLAPSVTKPGYSDPTLTAPFTSTELIARVISPNPTGDVANVVSYLNLSPSVDTGRIAVVFGTGGEAVLSLGLRPGADPLGVAQTLQAAAPNLFTWVSPNYVYSVGPAVLERIPNDPQYTGQWHLPAIDAPTAWDTTYGSPSVLVAVLDDGVDYRQPDLNPNLAINAGEVPNDGIDNDANGFVDDLFGWNFAGNNANVLPDDPTKDVHGTQVAGLLAARSDNAAGVAGVAGRVKFLPEKVVSHGTLTSLNLAKAAAYAVSRGAKIITNSTNIDPLVNDPVFTAAVDFAYDRGVLWVNSAGNGNVADPPRVAFEQMLLVAATDRADRKTDYSNYGRGIDISAPGGTAADGLLTTVPVAAGNYGFAFGTSMAAPIVAGTAALLWSANPHLTRDQVVSRLSATTDDLNFLNPGFEDQLGSGRVNAGAAVGAANITSRLGPITGLPGLGQAPHRAVTTFTLHLPNPLAVNSVTPGSFDLRSAGPDGQFDTTDDVLVPFTINEGRAYYYGTNDLTFTAYGLQSAGLFRFTAKSSSLLDPFGRPVDGDADGLPGGDLVRYFGVAPQIIGTSYEDIDGDGTEDSTEPGLGGTEVYIDDNHNGRFDETTFASTADELLIPDGSPAGVSSTLVVAGVDRPITRTKVTVTLRHPFPSDLTITLKGPDGTSVTLLKTRYLSVSPAGVTTLTFDDAAESPTVPDASGHLRPEEPLSRFAGSAANGPWTLTVRDTISQDEGSLVGWSLSLAVEPVAVSAPDGSFALPRDGVETKPIRVVPGPGWAPVQDENLAVIGSTLGVGMVRPGAVYGRAYTDSGHTPLKGVWVYDDANGNGRYDVAERAAIPDPAGNFVLDGLTTGTHRIRVSTPRAFSVVAPAGGGRVVTITPGTPRFGSDFILTTDVAGDRPLAQPVTPDPRNVAVGTVTFDLARPNDDLSLANLTLTRDGLPVPLGGTTLVGSGTRYTLIGLDPVTAAEGRYQVQLSLSGLPGGTNGPTTSPPAVGTWTVDTTPPTATLDAATPGRVVLSEPVTGLTSGNFTLTRNGLPVSLSGVTPVVNGSTVELIGLENATTNPGTYVLTLTPSAGVTDVAGNPLAAPAGVTFSVRPQPGDRFAVGADTGGTPLLTAYDPLSGAVAWKVFAFESTFTGGVRVTTGDVNGDGVADAVVSAGPGRAPEIRAFNGKDGTLLFSYLAFEPTFTGGTFVAAADLDGDGTAELAVTPDLGGGPRVRVLANAGQTVLADFFGIDDPNFRGGARAAFGDLNHDGTPDLVVAAGFGGGPRVAGYHGAALRTGQTVKLFADFFAFEPTVRNGIFVAAGDVTGDGYADLITAGGPGGGPRVQILDGQTLVNTGSRSALANFFAGDTSGRGGVRVAVKDLDGDGTPDLLAAAGSGQGSSVRGYLSTNLLSNPAPTPDRLFDAIPTFTGGIFVG